MTYSQIQLLAENISCDHCAMTIKRELQAIEGVRVVDVNVATKFVTLDYADERALSQAVELLSEIGYPAERVAP